MNYQKIYSDLIENAKIKNSTIQENECYEMHHIIPACMFKNHKRKGDMGHLLGNPDDENNLVRLTLREHYIAHLLLAKIHENTRYNYKMASCLFLMIKNLSKYKNNIKFNSRNYEIGRKLARNAISNKKLGKMPVKCAKTGVMIGDVDVNHENVLNGKWVHHSKGKKSVTNKETGLKEFIDVADYNPSIHIQNRPDFKKNKNPNYKELTEEVKNDLFDLVLECCENSHLNATLFYSKIKDVGIKHYNKKISSAFIGNKFGDINSLLKQFNSERNENIVYDSYYRKFKSYKNMNSGKKWYNNGVISKQMFPDNVEGGFVPGRLSK